MVKKRRAVLTGLGVGVATGMSGCLDLGGGGDSEAPPEEEQPQSDSDTTPDDAESGDGIDGGDDVDEIEDQHFEGTGSTVIHDVYAPEGVVIVEASYDGTGSFFPALVDETTNITLLNETGPSSWKRASIFSNTGAEDDTLTLDVRVGSDVPGGVDSDEDEGEEDQSWSLSISYQSIGEGESLPLSATGDAHDAYGPYAFTGTHTLTSNYEGDSQFFVRVVTGDERAPEILVDEYGEYSGQEDFTLERPGFVDITADGEWSVEIE